MIILDAFLRFSGLGLMLFVSTLLLKHLKHSNCARFLLLANLSAACHFLGFTPEIFNLPYQARLTFRLMDVFQVVFIWFFAQSLFEKNFKLTHWHIAVASIYCLATLMERLVQFDFINNLPSWWAFMVNGLSLSMALHMIKTALAGRSDDLVESRRKLRVYFTLVIAFSVLAVTILGSMLFSQYQPTVDVLGIWPTVVWGSYWVCTIPAGVFNFDHTEPAPESSLNSRDLDLYKRLNIEVIEKQCFLENDLSINSLANRLGVSAYRLRGFINKTLGHTNFSTYVNAHRIDSIKQAFAESENNHLPILTIAMNHGFSSLSPFNRAFKQIEGMTPREFRQNLSRHP